MFFNRISVRIGLWYAMAFLACALLLYAFTSYFLVNSLREKDKNLLNVKLRDYAALYQREGVNGLRNHAASGEIDQHHFLVRVGNAAGGTLFFHTPDRSADHDALTPAQIVAYLSARPHPPSWQVIEGKDMGDNIEVATLSLPDGQVLQVGKDSEDREEFLESFSQVYLLGVPPLFLAAIAIGLLLSNQLLRPIRSLSHTVKKIRAGNPGARVPLHRTGDELRDLSAQLNEMLADNERLVQGMRDTVDNLAHDIRTPIMRLQNSVEGALRGSANIEAYKEALFDCQDSAESLHRLVDGIMDIAEANAGTLSLKRESVSARRLIEAVMDLYGFVADEKKIRVEAGPGSDLVFEGDPVRLLQALSNLVDNALKYSSAGTTVSISAQGLADSGTIVVRDEGPGILEADRARIWERLYRGDASRASRGLGLGLSLVKAIVVAHGGNVGSRPGPQGGSEFFITLPVRENFTKIT